MKKRLYVHLKAWGVLIGSILILFTLMTSYSYAALVAYWPFDENSGNIANDSSGYGNQGAVSGATWVPGKCGNALSFNGSGYVLVPNSSSINLNVYTVSLWINFATVTRSQVFLDKQNGSHWRNYALDYYYQESAEGWPVGNYLMADIGDGSPVNSFDNGAVTTVDFEASRWYHIAMTYDQQYINLYVDGELRATKEITMPGITGPGHLYIGTNPAQGSSYAPYATMDEVKIHNTALSQAQIQADMVRCPTAPAVSGCLKVKGMPLDDTKVVLWQWLKRPQVTKTDKNGCFEFENVAPGKNFWLTIGGPEGSN